MKNKISKELLAIAKLLSTVAHDEDDPIDEFAEELGIGEEAVPNPEEVSDMVEKLVQEHGMEEAEEIADENMTNWRGVHHELNKKKQASKTFPTRINIKNVDYFLTGKRGNHKLDGESAEYENEHSTGEMIWVTEKGYVYDENNAPIGKIPMSKIAAKKVNEYAVCTKTTGREDEAKYKKCKEDIKKEQGGSGAKQGRVLNRLMAKDLKSGYDAVSFQENMKSIYENLNNGYVYLKNMPKLDKAKDSNAIRILQHSTGLISDFPHIIKDIIGLISRRVEGK